jgi:hypothetical protein
MTEWLKLMLEEIARKQAEQESGRAEQALREREQAQAPVHKPPSPRRK